MANFAEKVDKYVDRSYRYVPDKIDLSRTTVHMLDVQNLCLDKRGADYVQSVGGAPSGEETLVEAKRCLDAARANGLNVNWSMWGMDPDGYDIGLWGEKYPDWKKSDSPLTTAHSTARSVTDSCRPRARQCCANTATAASSSRL